MKSTVSIVAAAVLAAVVLVTAVVLRPGAAAQPASVWQPTSAGRPPAAQSPPAPGSDIQPVGGNGWRLAFADDFSNGAIDAAAWSDRSSAESDDGHGNQSNGQLEWNQAANCAVSGGRLALTARRQDMTSGAGTRYAWTSCLLSSTFTVQYGYLEERAVLPAAPGFWPAFWTWQADGANEQIETDVYEWRSAEPGRLLFTQHSGPGGDCAWRLPFDPSSGWHTYGTAIEPAGTTWYVDGAQVCHTAATSTGPTTLIVNLAVDAENPPPAGVSEAVAFVDYVRVWTR
jgi:beta-glucanase (GH16 family)